VAGLRAGELISGKYARYDAVIIGGETTPTLPDKAGKGGRNQHYAAVSLLAMAEYLGEWTLASVGTDGSDFLPDVAGAIVDKNSLLTARGKGIDISAYLRRYDSFSLLEKIGHSLIKTGNTGTNVGDVLVYVLG
jgi:glycerate-2-kinase